MEQTTRSETHLQNANKLIFNSIRCSYQQTKNTKILVKSDTIEHSIEFEYDSLQIKRIRSQLCFCSRSYGCFFLLCVGQFSNSEWKIVQIIRKY